MTAIKSLKKPQNIFCFWHYVALGVTIWHGKMCYNIHVMGDVAVTHGSAKNQTVTQKKRTVFKKAYNDNDNGNENENKNENKNDNANGKDKEGWNPHIIPPYRFSSVLKKAPLTLAPRTPSPCSAQQKKEIYMLYIKLYGTDSSISPVMRNAMKLSGSPSLQDRSLRQ